MTPPAQPNLAPRPATAPPPAGEEPFRALFDHNLDAVILGIPDGRVLAANAAACAMFGRTEEEIRHIGRRGLVDPADPRLAEILAHRTRDGNVRGQLRFVRKDGTRFEADYTSVAFTDRQGEPRVSVIIRDISERVRAEAIAKLQRELAIRLAAATSVIDGLTLCLDAAIEIAGVDSGRFYLRDEKSGALNLAVHRGVSAEFVGSVQQLGPDTMQARLVASGAVRYAELDLLSHDRPESERREGLQFLAIVPFRTEQRAIGCLSLCAHRMHQIGALEREALETIAANAALAIARMRTEATLRDERSRLSNIIAGTHVATWEWNAQTNETVINETWAEMLGYTLAELQPTTRDTWERIVHPDDSRDSWNLLQHHLSSATPFYECECRLRHKAGHWIWVLNRGRLLNRTATGEPLTVFGTHVEITAMKLAQAKLRETEQNYREIFNATHDAIYVHEAATGRVLDVNDGMLRMFGFASKEEYLASSPLATFVDEPAFSMPEAIRRMQLAAQGQPQLFEWKACTKNRKMMWLEVSLRSAQIGGQPRILAVVRDITRRKQAEEALGETEERFEKAFHHSPSLMSLSRLDDGTFVDVNDRLVALAGCRREKIIGRSSVQLGWIKPEDRAQMAEIVKATGRVQDLEITLTFPDGRQIDLLFAAELIKVAGQSLLLSNATDITDRKRAEAALRESEERFLTAFRRSPSLKTISRLADGVYLDANDRFFEVFGFTRDEVVGRKSVDVGLIGGADRVRLMAALQDRHSLEKMSATLTAKDGRRIDVEFGCELLMIHGEPCVLWSATDVTAQKRAAAELEANRQRLSAALASMTDAVFISDRHGNFIEFNEAFATFHKFRSKAECARTLAEYPVFLDVFGHDGSLTPLDQWAVTRALRGETDTNVEFSLRRKDTGEKWAGSYSFAPIRGDGGEVVGSVVVARDITASRAAQQLLRLHGAALEVAANAVMISNYAGRIEWVNPAFTALSGWSFEEALGKIPGALLNSDAHDEAFHRQMHQTVYAGKVWRGEIVNRRKDGALRTVEMTVTPLRDASGQITHFISIKQDITERKALEAQNRQAQRMEAIGTLASGIAHDLNNILAPMLMVSGLLKEKLPDESDQEILAMLHQGAQRGANIIKQLLTFSRGQGGERVAVQSRHILKEMVAIMRETFPKEIDLRISLPALLPLINADPTQLHQVVLNLCVNARDAMPDGGRLSLSAASVKLREGDPHLPPEKAPGDFVVIEVRDSGHGIPPEIKHRIFDPFFTTKPLGKGTGLGLSTVMGIVRSHQGFITVDSQPGQGSSFKVFLPAVTESVAPEEPVADEPAAAGRGQLILIVDDERNVRDAVRLVLASGGFRSLSAVNGKDALTQYLSHRREIALVLTDVMMPVMNGIALIRSLQALDVALPLVVMSGMSEVAQQAELAALGVTDILPKPFDDTALLEAIERQLAAKK